MTEVQFAKSFLAALDARPVKIPADYVEDPRRYPARPPYTLPRMPKAMRKPASGARAPGQARNVAVVVKSVHRTAPVLDVRLTRPDFALATTSLLDVRTALAEQTHVPLAKLRLLYNKKPVADSKVLRDVAGDSDDDQVSEIELSVMVTGGAATVAAAAAAEAEAAKAKAMEPAAEPALSAASPTVASPAAAVPSAGGVVADSEAFWNDLRGFLVQRTGDVKQADELFSLFLRAWEDRMT